MVRTFESFDPNVGLLQCPTKPNKIGPVPKDSTPPAPTGPVYSRNKITENHMRHSDAPACPGRTRGVPGTRSALMNLLVLFS
ncbi:hypothetical protein M8J75_002401 [Diaphorina citri]|nr:hypothetical protein M8J75_002401 [Diaphorina citri]